MALQNTRDIVIIIFGIAGTIYFILLFITALSVWKRLNKLSALAAGALDGLQKVVAEVKEAIKPIAQIIGIIEAAGKGIDVVSKIFKMKKGGTEDDQRTVD
jgi:hypothetical protein